MYEGFYRTCEDCGNGVGPLTPQDCAAGKAECDCGGTAYVTETLVDYVEMLEDRVAALEEKLSNPKIETED